jgi:hypothetical protein
MKQITIVAEDKVGLLADISYILGKAKINIEAISVEVQGEQAVICLTVKDERKAAAMLSANGYRVLASEVLVVKVSDKPGELSKISRMLLESNINVESLYLLSRHHGFSLDAVTVDNPKKAKNVLAEYLVKGQ